MNNINIQTKGSPIRATYSKLRTHSEIGCEMANLHLKMGDMEVNIIFDTWDEMIAFCEAHNFPYDDERQEPTAAA